MYIIEDIRLLKCDHNRRDRKVTGIIRQGIIWLVAMLAALVYIGCEEPSSDISTPSVVGTPDLTSTPLGSTCVFSRITPVGLSNPVIGADGTVYIATSKALYAIEVDGTGKRQFDIPDMTITTTIAPAIGADGTVYIARGKRLYVIDADGKLKNTLDLASTIATTITKAPAISKDGSTIYIASGNTLYAINADGTLKWLLPYKTTEAITASPSVGSDGVIYIARGKTLYAIDAEGKLKNTLDLSSTITEAITHSPVVDADGVIYIASGKTLYAINAEGTELLRQFDISDTITTAPAVSRDAVVYVGTENGCLYAIDVDVARKKYRTGGAVVSSPAIGKDGTIYVGSDDSNLYAIARDGTHLWAYATKGAVRSSPSIGADGTIYVGSDDSKLHAIHGDGTRKWVYATGGQVRSSPSIGADGTIYVGSDDSNLYAIARDGTKRWAYKTEGQVRSSPAIGNIAGEERIYIGSNAPDNRLYVIDTKGETLWKRNSSGAVRSSPALGKEGEVYIGSSDGFVYAYNANGTQRWGYRVGSPVVSSPAIMVDDKGVSTIIIGTVDGLHAIDAESGINQWTKAEMGHVRSSPAIGSDGTIYVGAENGNFYRLDENGEIEKEEYIGSVGLSSPVIGDEQVIIGTQTGIVYVIESEATGYAESSWPGRGHDGLHSGRGVPVEGFEGYELRAPTLDSPKSIHYNRFKVLLNYTDEMAGNNKVGAPLSVNDVEMTLYYSTTNTFPPAIPASSFSQNTADKGRVTKRILTTLTTNTIETPALLRENTDYYYMIQATQVRAPKQTRYSNMIQVKTPYEAILPGKATGLTADVSKKQELTFKATPPSNRGTKKDGLPVDAKDIKYWLYYAKVGYTPSGKAKVTTTTNAAAVVQAVGKVTGTSNKNIGKIELTGNTELKKGFLLDGLTGGVQYRYTVVVVHPEDDALKSTTPAETATVQSEATAPGAVRPSYTEVNGIVTIKATPPSNRGKQADGTTDVGEEDIKYELYYALVGRTINSIAVTTSTNAADVVQAVGTTTLSNSDVGKIELTGNTELKKGFALSGLTSGAKYRYTIVAVHPEYDAIRKASVPKTISTKRIQASLEITPPPDTPWGTAIQLILAANGSGSGAVTYARVSGTATATVTSSGRVTATGPGTVVVQATKAEGTRYIARTSSTVTVTFTRQTQASLRITTPRSKPWGTAIQLILAANGSGSGAVTYARVSGTATVTSSGRVTATGPGTVVVRATKAEDTLYKAQTSPAVTVTFTRQAQALLKINTPPDTPWGTAIQLSLATKGSGGGAVTYAKVRGTATVTSSGRVTAKGPGTVVVRATKAEDTLYKAQASSTVTVTFTLRTRNRPSAPSITGGSNISWRLSYTIAGYNSKYEYRISPSRTGVSISGGTISSTNAMSNIRVQRRWKATTKYEESSWSSSSSAVNFVTILRGSVTRITGNGSDDPGSTMEVKDYIYLKMYSSKSLSKKNRLTNTLHKGSPNEVMWQDTGSGTDIPKRGDKSYSRGTRARTHSLPYSASYKNYYVVVYSDLREDDDTSADDNFGSEEDKWSLSSILSSIRGDTNKRTTRTHSPIGGGNSLIITVEFELMER